MTTKQFAAVFFGPWMRSIAFWKRPDFAITIDYGQAPARAEIQSAGEVCRELKIEHAVLTVDCSSLGSGDLANVPVADLEQRFGRYGRRLSELAHGIDRGEVKPDRPTQSISAEDTFAAKEVRLQPARIFLSVEKDPDTKVKGWRRSARHASHPAWPALGSSKCESLTVCPRDRAGIRAGVGDDSIQNYTGRAAHGTEFKGEDR